MWLRTLFRRAEVERELNEEIAYHLEAKTALYVSQGMTPDDAHNAAVRDMRGVTLAKEECRDARGLRWIEDLLRDVSYATRMLRRNPGFTAVIVLSLALGIGANTAIFSLIDTLVLRMLPVRNPEQLVAASVTTYFPIMKVSKSGDTFPRATYEALRDHNDVFSYTVAVNGMERPEIVVGGDADYSRDVELVTGNYFEMLGVSAEVGRVITVVDDQPSGTKAIAVLGYGYWRSRFGANSQVVGQKILVNGVPLEIVGVASARFYGLSPDAAPDMWIPSAMQDALVPHALANTSYVESNVIGRLKPGVDIRRAQAALDLVYKTLPKEDPKADSTEGPLELFSIGHGYSELRADYRRPLNMLMVVVALVLLVACGNVANLLLARAAARRTEIGIRMAIGAGRGRLIRQLLTESMLLAVFGGIVGLIFAYEGSAALLGLLPVSAVPPALAWHLDFRVLGFTVGVSLLTGLLFGLLPALRSTRVELKKRPTLRLSKLLVVSQVALSLLLLVAAGLFLRSLDKLRAIDLGLQSGNLLQASIDTRAAGLRGPALAAAYQQLLDRIAAIPGVRSVSSVRNGLLQNGITHTSVTLPGHSDLTVESCEIGPRFFETIGTPVRFGRDVATSDNTHAPKVVVINEMMARQLFGTENAVGRQFNAGTRGPLYEVIGVVENVRMVSLRWMLQPMMFFPTLQRANLDRISSLQIRTVGDPATVSRAIREQIASIDKRLPGDIKTIRQQVEDGLVQERMIGKLSAIFGLLGLLLASVGLYGMMAYSVARRTGEIGIRMALGAVSRDVLWMVLRETLALVLAGVAIGVPLAFAAGRLANHWLGRMLFGVNATDPITLGVASLVMALVALLAGALPARRASKLDPMVALRYE